MREKVVIFGINKNPDGLYETLKTKYEIVGWVDSNEEYQHKYNEKTVSHLKRLTCLAERAVPSFSSYLYIVLRR